MRVLWLIPLLAWSAFGGQPVSIAFGKGSLPGHTIVAAIPPIDIPSTIGLTISNRWMTTTNTLGAYGSSVTNWPDETNSFRWVLGTHNGTSLTVTNSVDGVWFDSTHFLFGTNTIPDSTRVQFFIFKWMEPSQGALNDVVFNDDVLGLGTGWDITGSSPPYYFPQGGASVIFVTTNVLFNLIGFGPNNIAGGTVYTNGVLSTTTATLHNCPDGVNIGAIFKNSNGFNGYLKELIVFTNTTISSSQVSNLNYYANHLYW